MKLGQVGAHDAAIVPPWVQKKLEKAQPVVTEEVPVAPNGNTGVVPPHILDKLGQKVPVKGLPQDGDCFPDLPVRTDPSGVDVIFTDVVLPRTAPQDLPKLTVPDRGCFPPVPQTEAGALFDGVVLPCGVAQGYAYAVPKLN